MISSCSGKRCSACLEKIRSPSATTSNTPLSPSISSASTPSALLMAAARPEASGRYFQRVQYSIDSLILNLPQPASYARPAAASIRFGSPRGFAAGSYAMPARRQAATVAAS